MKLIVVGKVKNKHLKELISDYEKRISRYCKLDIIEIKDESESNDKALDIEGDKILSKIDNKDFVIILDKDGIMLDSVSLAKKLDNIYKQFRVTFVIGSSLGLSSKVINRANLSISFSKFTFPHQLFRLMFLEQLYRTFKINNNERYHK